MAYYHIKVSKVCEIFKCNNMDSVFAGFNIFLFSDLFYFVGNKVIIDRTEVIKYKKV